MMKQEKRLSNCPGSRRGKRSRNRPGFTLIELTLVMLLILTIASAGFYSFSAYSDWRQGSDASQTLKKVYIAQRLYLADNPGVAVGTLTQATLTAENYIQAPFPTVNALDGTPLIIDVSVSPPVVTSGGAAYDPSGNANDSLWDVGL